MKSVEATQAAFAPNLLLLSDTLTLQETSGNIHSLKSTRFEMLNVPSNSNHGNRPLAEKAHGSVSPIMVAHSMMARYNDTK